MKWPFLLGLLFLVARAVNVTTTVVAVPAVSIVSQDNYEWYANVDALTPTAPLAGENTVATVPAVGGAARLRMNVGDADLLVPAGTTFLLQYANSPSGAWTTLGTSTPWIFFDNPSVPDGQVVVSTVLPESTVGESYGESNPSAASPLALVPGDVGEWDWVIENNGANTSLNWFFRMTYASGTLFDTYENYPEFTAMASSSGGGGGGSGGSGGGVQGSGGGTGYYRGNSTTTYSAPPPLVPPAYQCMDFNGDGKVDIIDLSIMLYYYEQPIPANTNVGCLLGLTHSNIINFQDVSILMYYWTG